LGPFAFIGACDKIMLFEALKGLVDPSIVFDLIVGIDRYVVEIYNDALIENIVKYIIEEELEAGGCVAKAISYDH